MGVMQYLNRAVRQAWLVLTKPRSLFGAPRQERRGVAILVVVAALMIITVLVTELVYAARVRYMVAVHERDKVQAYWLARSGVNLHHMILVANKQIGANPQIKSMLEGTGISAEDGIWQMVPVINTGLLRMLLGSGGSLSSVDEEDLETFQQTGRVSDEFAEEEGSGGLFDDRDFLDFEGDFSSEIVDQESRINVNAFAADASATIQESPTAQLIFALMSGEEADRWFRQRNIDRWEIIGNLKDWVDQDTLRSGGRGGYEDTLYNTLDPPYLTKNAPFDSPGEIRLVAGWEGEVCDKYCDKLTVYGEANGKLNMNTMDDAFVAALATACQTAQIYPDTFVRAFDAIEQRYYPFGPTWTKPEEMARDLAEVGGLPVDQPCITGKLTTSSNTFAITSTGIVGTSEVTIESIVDFSGNSSEGKLVYWRVR